MIYLHIGQAKSGTSILQNALHQVAKGGGEFLYPDTFRHPGVGHHALAAAVKGRTNFDECMHDLKKLLSAAGGKDVVFSSEDFSNAIGPRCRNNFSDFLNILCLFDRVKIVVYQRRYDDFLNSMFLQSARYGRIDPDPEQYVRARLLSVDTWFSSILNLKRDNRVELLYFPQRAGFDVIDSFCQISKVFSGLKDPLELPITAKFSYKQQLFISFSKDILSNPPTRQQMERMVIAMRKKKIILQNDYLNYVVISESSCISAAKAALQAASRYECSEYVEAFGDGISLPGPYLPYSPSCLTHDDIDLMFHLSQS